MKVDFLCIGAHPDDCEIAMGGTIAKMVNQGYKVMILDLTNGEPTPRGSVEKRIKEAKKAAEILGVQRITLDLKNRFLFDSIESRFKVASIIRKYRPEVIFCHLEIDAHPDHVQAFNISYASRFYSKLTKVPLDGDSWYPRKIIRFFSNHLRINITPSFVVDISDFIEKKIEACKAYESQFSSFDVEEYVKTFAKYWGLLIRSKYAEPFFSHELISLDPSSLLI
ncbi:MAG: bacillithiol biosynthesis deacetylase BshB1 [Candidatus Calescibacterium sp.]|nr:bacillithiol biosynthesis deacetylase BshB1 [Candidatus Calescibacterium sp.]MDW8133331.1 bacillithiol biosynthesis deacetylase BshB1 [Candidatus Calescibacterium sp.]